MLFDSVYVKIYPSKLLANATALWCPISSFSRIGEKSSDFGSESTRKKVWLVFVLCICHFKYEYVVFTLQTMISNKSDVNVRVNVFLRESKQSCYIF